MKRKLSKVYCLTFDSPFNLYSLEDTELSITNKDEKFKIFYNVFVYDKNNLINIELNPRNHTGQIIKNLSYAFHLLSSKE